MEARGALERVGSRLPRGWGDFLGQIAHATEVERERQRALELEHAPLEREPTPVTAEPVRGNHAVAGDDDRQRVRRHVHADRARILHPGRNSELPVRDRAPVWRDSAERLQHLAMRRVTPRQSKRTSNSSRSPRAYSASCVAALCAIDAATASPCEVSTERSPGSRTRHTPSAVASMPKLPSGVPTTAMPRLAVCAGTGQGRRPAALGRASTVSPSARATRATPRSEVAITSSERVVATAKQSAMDTSQTFRS